MKYALLMLPIGVIVFCCWFFSNVFDRTMAVCDSDVPLVQITVASDVHSNLVMRVLRKEDLKKTIYEAIENRNSIVQKEHDRFRAELATWLSIFGLLSILATLIVPVCSYHIQHSELEKLEGKIDYIENARREVKSASEDVKDAKDNYISVMSADAESEDMESGVGELRDELRMFKMMWGAGKNGAKIDAGIKVIRGCSDGIKNAIEENDVELLRECLNILNNVSAYLNQSAVTQFKKEFVLELSKVKPLADHSKDVQNLLSKLDAHKCSIYMGFYSHMLDLQDRS